MTRWSQFKNAFSSPQAFRRYCEAPAPVGVDPDDDTFRKDRWTNLDLAPSPPQDRIWNKWVYLAFWVAHAANAGNWTAGSSIIALGLNPLDAWLALASSHILITVFIVANGRGPARYHIGFPVMSRSVYGMWGSYMVIFMRAIVCIIWNGVNSYYGGRLVVVAITCIWPSFKTLPNALPASAGISSVNLAGFFIYMLFFTAISFIHSRDLKWFYIGKGIAVFIAMHALLAWWMVQVPNVSFRTLAGTAPMDRTRHIWLVLQAFNTGLGTASSLSVNQGDMARYASKPTDPLWTTLIGYPIASAIPCLYGILVAAAGKALTGKALWNIWDTLDYMQERYPDNRGARFGIFLLAISFAIAFLAVSLATNSLPFGSDVAALFPRWMTIRRGQVICTMLSAAICPWLILTNARAFITFLSGYGYWLSPIAAILSVDYFLIKKGNIIVPDLFVGNETGRYWYTRGINWRAVSITIISLIPCMPAFAASIAPTRVSIPVSAQRLFYISFTMTWFIAAALYYVSYLIFPEKNVARPEKQMKFEQIADEDDEREAAEIAMGGAEEGREGSFVEKDGHDKNQTIVLSNTHELR